MPADEHRLFGRDDVNPRLRREHALDCGQFLARLWAHFGPPSARPGGFAYQLVDRHTGLGFTASAGPNGPSYGGDLDHRHRLRTVLHAFEQLLEFTPPIECAMPYSAEHDRAPRVVGWRAGTSFDIAERRGSTVTERRAPQQGS